MCCSGEAVASLRGEAKLRFRSLQVGLVAKNKSFSADYADFADYFATATREVAGRRNETRPSIVGSRYPDNGLAGLWGTKAPPAFPAQNFARARDRLFRVLPRYNEAPGSL